MGIFLSAPVFAESVNLALKKPATASSTYENYKPALANDGISNIDANFWCAALGESANSWWCVDLGEKFKIIEVKIKFRGPSAIYRFIPGSIAILVSDDNKNWTTALSKSKNLPAVSSNYENEMSSFPVNTRSRYVKLFFEDKTSDSPEFIELLEVEILGDTSSK
jgi:hypothetical protein